MDGAGAASLRARADVARALGGPRNSALRPLRAVREELAERRNASSALRTQARSGVGGNGQGAARWNAAMERWEAGVPIARRASRFRREKEKSASRRSIPSCE